MNTVTLGLSSRQKTNKRVLEAFKGKSQGAFISFESPDLLFKVLSGNRWELLKIMTGAGAISIREASRRLGRDVKAVHGPPRAFGMLRRLLPVTLIGGIIIRARVAKEVIGKGRPVAPGPAEIVL